MRPGKFVAKDGSPSTLRVANTESTPVSTILTQMGEARPLPMGRKEFDEWSDRIISGALLPGGEEDKEAFIESLKVGLAQMIMHLGPTESHKPDAFFIHALRKGAINQVAWSVVQEADLKKKEKLKEQIQTGGSQDEDVDDLDELPAAC